MAANALPLLSLPIITRVLTKEQYGAWALATVYGSFVSGVANFGMTISYDRNFFEFRESAESAKLLYSTIAFVVSMFLACGVLTWIFRESLAQAFTQSRANAALLFWTFCAVGVASLKTYFLSYFKNTGNAKAHVRYTLDESLLGVLLSLVFVALVRVGPVGLAWGPLLASTAVLSVLTVRFLVTLPPRFDRAILWHSLKLSLPLTPRILLGVVGTQFDKYLVGRLGSVGGAAIYSIGQRMANIVFNYMTSLENVFAPQVYERMFSLRERGGESVGRYLTPFIYASVGIALLVSLTAQEVVSLLTPPSYHAATAIVNVLTIHYALMFFGKQPQLIYTKKTHITSLLSMVSLVMSVGITILFVKTWGVLGAAFGTLVAGAISVAMFVSVGQRFYRIEYETRKLAAIYATFIAMSLSMLGVQALALGLLARLMLKALFVAAFLYLGLSLQIMTRDAFARLGFPRKG